MIHGTTERILVSTYLEVSLALLKIEKSALNNVNTKLAGIAYTGYLNFF